MDYPVVHGWNGLQIAGLRLLIDPSLQIPERDEDPPHQSRILQRHAVTPFHGHGELQGVNGIQPQAVRAEEQLVGADTLWFDAEQGVFDQDNPQIIEGRLIFCHNLTTNLLITG